MGTGVDVAGIHELVQRQNVRYEVRPYYVVLDQRPVGAPPIEQRITAGFDVDLYGTLEKEQFPLFRTDEAHRVLHYFESLAAEIQPRIGQKCAIEVIPYSESVVLDTHQDFQPQVVLRIRITHDRGLDQPAGPAEDQALSAIRGTLSELGIREK